MKTFQVTLDIEQLEEGPYLGTSPDLPGLIVQAESPEKVIALAPDKGTLHAILKQLGISREEFDSA